MSQLNSAEYYRNRERQERSLADAARDPHIAKIHAEMAARYVELCDRASPQFGLRLAASA